MDRSGKVAGAYRRLQVLKQARQIEAAVPEFPTGPFQVIVADPPWRYESGNDLPYPTMAIEDIKALPVESIAADDSLLWLWTTNAHLRVAFEVVGAWGFEYKTLLTWVKDRMGTGCIPVVGLQRYLQFRLILVVCGYRELSSVFD